MNIEAIALDQLPEVGPGDPIGTLVARAASGSGIDLVDGDLIAISQKVVSKAEGRTRSLAEVEPGDRARKLAAETGRDPRLVELVLGEARRVVRATKAVLIVETRSGWICANAGIDSSNVPAKGTVALLPADADESARRIRAELEAAAGARPGVLITDSFGRPWRLGQSEVAIGLAGVVAVDDWRGRADAHGHELAATAIAVADQLAGAADLARAKDSARPAVLLRGAGRFRTADNGPGAVALQRPADADLFR